MPNNDDHPFRVTLFGPLRIVGPAGDEIPQEAWGHRPRAKTLLMALLSRQGRRCSRDGLLEVVMADPSAKNAGQYLDTLMHHLRRVLNAGGSSLLVTHKGYLGGPVFYSLPGQETLWCDVDAFLALCEQAATCESQGGDPLRVYEEAEHLARGVFVEDEMYSEWARDWRARIGAMRSRMLKRLALLYQQRGMLPHAERLLRAFLADDPTDQDAVCDLMSLLDAEGRHIEALHLYEHTERTLGQDEIPIASPLAALGARLHEAAARPPLPLPSVQPMVPVWSAVTTQLPALIDDIPPEYHYHILAGQVMTVALVQGRSLPDLCEDIRRGLLSGLRRIDRMSAHSEDVRLSRREALCTLAMLPVTLAVLIRREQRTLMAEELLPQCAVSLTACWQLVNGFDLRTAETALPYYMPLLVTLAHQAPSSNQRMAAGLVAQGYQLHSILALHRNHSTEREAAARKAIVFGRLTNEPDSYIGAVRQLLATIRSADQPAKTIEVYQEAQASLEDASASLQSAIKLNLAWAYASMGQKQEALAMMGKAWDIFPATGDDADFGLPWVYLYQGVIQLRLGNSRAAWESFTALDAASTPMPERMRLELVTHQAYAALALRDLELTRACIITGVQGAQALGSAKRYSEAFDAYQNARIAWPGEHKVAELADLFVH